MRITRTGSERNRGTTELIPSIKFQTGNEYDFLDTVRWEEWSKQIIIQPRWIPHSDGVTHHNYRIELTLEDISALIESFGHAASKRDATHLRDHLNNNIQAIVKLLACATGIKPEDLEGVMEENA